MRIKFLFTVISIFLISSISIAQNINSRDRLINSGSIIKPLENIKSNSREFKKANIKRSLSKNSARTSSEVGTTPAEFSVSLSGSAVYNIPIATPPGIRDVNPNIALGYSSQASNGIGGWGWGISGLSSITRVSATQFHDGFVDGVDFDSEDRFVLDGQRLLIKTGTYGASNSEYQTETFSNIKITAIGTSPYGTAYGPSYFILYYPDGSRAWYGNNSNSRSRLGWSIHKKIDAQGNIVQYDYATDGQLRAIDKISFGHRSGSAPVEINFFYTTRTRPESSYASGIQFKRTKILDRIETKGNGILYRKYTLDYDETSLDYQRLISVTEYNKSNQALTPILFNYNNSSATPFPDIYSGSLTPEFDSETDKLLTGDYNGDGELDFIHYDDDIRNRIYVFDNLFDSSNNNSIGHSYNVPVFDDVISNNMLNDENKLLAQQGIGLIKETLSGNTSTVTFRNYYSGSAGLYHQYTKTWNAPTYLSESSCGNSIRKKIPKDYIEGDFNGDGLTDVLAVGKPYVSVNCFEYDCGPGPDLPDLPDDPQESQESPESIDKSSSTRSTCCSCNSSTSNYRFTYLLDLNRNLTSGFINPAGSLEEVVDENDRLVASDFNGDGKTNLLHFKEGKVLVYEIDSNNLLSLIYQVSDSNIKLNAPILLGDYNGDGKTDFITPIANNSNSWRFFLSRGTNITRYTKVIDQFTYQQDVLLGNYNYSQGPNREGIGEYKFISQDVNGDGKSDLIKHLIVSAYSTDHTYSDESVNIHVNLFDTADSRPKFEHASHYDRANSGVSKLGIPLALNVQNRTDKLEYGYISGNHFSAYEFEGNHRKDIELLQINNNGTIHNIDYFGLEGDDTSSLPTYTESFDQEYPYFNVNLASSVSLVGKVTETSGGYTRYQDYLYTGGTSHVQGLGFLGFKQIRKTNIYGNSVQALWNITDFDIQKRGSPIRNWVSESSFDTPSNYINKIDYSYDTQLLTNNVYLSLKTQEISEDILTGVINNTSYEYDTFYNPITITTTFPGGSETVVQEFINNPSSNSSLYTIGRLLRKSTTSVLNSDSFTTDIEFTYSNNLTTQIRRKGNGTPWLYENYQYDYFGNVIQKSISGSGITTRNESFEFDSSGRYMNKSIDSEGLETNYNYSLATGYPVLVTNSYGIPIEYRYDDWGRIDRETDYLGTHTFTTYDNSTLYGAGGSIKTINYDGGEDQKIYYNALGWVMKTGVLSVNNKWIFKSYEYDEHGEKLRDSEPYFSSAAPTQWNQYSYDIYRRPIAQQLFIGRIINTTYNGLTITVDDGIKSVSSTKDAAGNVIQVQDEGGIIDYTYYANGEMKTANYGGHIVSFSIDGWGRKTSLTDPSAGTYNYEYNILGDLLSQSTPKGTTTYTYDTTGKLQSKSILGDETDLALQYAYSPETKLLTVIEGVNGISGTQYDYRFYYDEYKRIDKITEEYGTASFEKQIAFNGNGTVASETYITNDLITGVSNNVKVKNIYESNSGILKEIRDFNSNGLLWKINTEDARGNALDISLGNGIKKTRSYDTYGYLTNMKDVKPSIGTIGNTSEPIIALDMDYEFDSQRGFLNNRTNNKFSSWYENFSYDNLDRLTSITGNVTDSKSYDQRGRITSNSSVGDYNYFTSNAYRLQNIDLNNQGDLYYQQNNQQSITYNSFKMPLRIYEENKGRVDFEYGPMMNRTQAYYGGLEEDKLQRKYRKQYSSIIPVEIVENNTTGSTKIITYIGGNEYSAPVAQIKQEGGGNTFNDYHYLHRDYLGSILAISNSNAEIVEQRHFGAWGETDKYLNSQGESSFSHDSLIGRGFTGHEHFFDISLIHMNGRIYDPHLGRFLSPDNHIQDSYNTQSFNRYGYVWNNPLSNIDPTGEEIFTIAVLIGVIVGAVSGAAAYIGNAIQTGNWDWGSFGLAVLGGAIVGGITYGIAPSLAWGAGTYLSVAFVGIIGAFLPTYNVPIGDWNISISPSIALGNASGIGASVSVSYSDGDWNFSAGIGFMYYGNYNGFGNGVEIRRSILAAYDDGTTGFSLGTNWWSGSLSGVGGTLHQRTGLVGFRNGDFRLRYENDGGFGFNQLQLGDKGDSYRTASLQIGVGDFSVGFQLFTGRRSKADQDVEDEYRVTNDKGKLVHPVYDPQLRGAFGRKFKRGFVNEVGPPYRLGALTFGYKGFQLGVNSEHVSHAIQGRVIHGLTKDRGFTIQSWDWKGYAQFRTPNAFTSW